MKFILLIKGEDKFAELSPSEMQATVAKFSAWAGKLKEEGRLVDAEGLAPEGRLIGSSEGIIFDGPFTETKDMVGGYYVFTADTLDEATAIGRQCPALDYGGSLELRPQMSYD